MRVRVRARVRVRVRVRVGARVGARAGARLRVRLRVRVATWREGSKRKLLMVPQVLCRVAGWRGVRPGVAPDKG